MRRIHKSGEPRCLLAHRKKPDADYANLPSGPGECKDRIRDALLNDQGFLCVYCMRRIRRHWSWMRIEHFQAQKPHPELQLTWSNLFAVCPGQGDKPDGARTPPAMHHCDRKKGAVCPSDRAR